MASTADVAMNMPEVLEQIFFFSDLRTLLSTQRVCRAWHNLITQSPSIQKHLFFQPDPGCTAARLNPLLCELFPQWFQEVGSEEAVGLTPRDFQSLPLVKPELNAAFKREAASWRRMLPRQPPPKKLKHCEFWSSYEFSGIIISSVSEKDEKPQAVADEQQDEKISPSAPLRMETLYRLVLDKDDQSDIWLFLWGVGDKHDSLPAKVGYRRVPLPNGRVKDALDSVLKRDNVVLLEFTEFSCTPQDVEDFAEEYRLVGRGTDIIKEKLFEEDYYTRNFGP